jgi:hypothetical protein
MKACSSGYSWLWALASLLLPCSASANGRFPAASQLVGSPSGAEWVLRTTFGLVVSHDRGATWNMVCEAAVGYGGVEDPAIAVLGETHLLVGLYRGLSVSHDGGRTFGFVDGPVGKSPIVDVTAGIAGRGYALAGGTGDTTGGDQGDQSISPTLFETSDFGNSWSVERSLDRTVRFETVEVAPSDSKRIYLSGTRGRRAEAVGTLFVSKNGGATFLEHRMVLLAGERAPFLAAVHPKSPDHLWVRTYGGGRERLLESRDAGQSFTEVFADPSGVRGFALLSQGEDVLVGSPAGGLLGRAPRTSAFESRSHVSVQCLAAGPEALFACSDRGSGFIVGRSTDGGKTFSPALTFERMGAPIEGTMHVSGETCQTAWPAIRAQLGLPLPPKSEDGGNASLPDTSNRPKRESGGKSCHCDAAGIGQSETPLSFLLVVAAAYGFRRRSRAA